MDKADDLALQICNEIRAGVVSSRPGERTRQLSGVLEELAVLSPHSIQYDKFSTGEWMGIDFWWWFKKDEEDRGLLAAESQWWNERWDIRRNEAEILEDFCKLPSLKSDIKLMVF